MDIIEEFEKHANECQRMSRFTHDRESKAVWNRMAERWMTLVVKEKARAAEHAETRAIRRTRLLHRSAERSQAA